MKNWLKASQSQCILIGIIFFGIMLSPFYSKGQNYSVIDSLENLLSKSQESLPDTTRIKILKKLCWDYKYSNLDKAFRYCRKCLTLLKQLDNKGEIAAVMNMMGLLYKLQGNYDEALNYYLKSLKIHEALDNKNGISISLDNIGEIYVKHEDYEKAIEYYMKALKIREKIRDQKGIAGSLNNIGIAYYYQANYDKAIDYFRRSLDIKDLLGDKQGISISLNNIGSIYYEKGDYEMAIFYYSKALRMDEELGSKHGMATRLHNLGEIYSKQGDYIKAIEYLQRGIKVAREIDLKYVIKHAYQNLSLVYTKQHNYKDAYKYYKFFSEIKDSLFNEESHKQITEMQTKYETEKKEKEIALLNKEKQLQKTELAKKQAEVKKKNIQRNAFIGGFALVLVLALVVYRGYNQKKKSNKILTEKNILITQQKAELTQTLEELRATQEQLVESEKMASLGNLVAGVAHEINTPVGIGITASSSLVEDTKQFAELYKKDKMNRKALEEYLENTFQASKLILKNMNRTGELVQSFKQVSVDQLVDEKRKFNLKSYLQDIMLSIKPEFKEKQIKIIVETYRDTSLCDDDIEINSYPGVFTQIITNLTLNSIRHGFRERNEGEIKITAHTYDLTPSPSPEGEGSKSPSSQEGDIVGGHLGEDLGGAALILQYSDNGIGISKENLPKIFDPFFTTNKQIGTGLGLHIVYNLVTQKLKGTINCESELEKGVLFTINIPIT